MLNHKLSQLKIESQLNTAALKAIDSISILLNEIDFTSEIIPHENLPKFIALLSFIKGSKITLNEKEIAKKLIQN